MNDPKQMMMNRCDHTLEELAPYIDQFVAWSLDGRTVLAHAKDEADLYKEVNRLGLKSTSYVIGYVDNPEFSRLGGGLNASDLSPQDL